LALGGTLMRVRAMNASSEFGHDLSATFRDHV
jgi:hypothetical protein